MLSACIATKVGPSSTRMLSVHLQPPLSPAATPPGHARHGGPGCLLGPRVREGLTVPWRILRCPRVCHMDLGSCFAKETLSSRTVVASSPCTRCSHKLLVSCPPITPASPAAPGTGWATRQVMSVSSFSNVERTENYPAKEKCRGFLFYCLSEGLARGAGWKEVWWK